MKADTFSKWIMKASLVQGFMMLWASYALAAVGRTQIAEDLSKVVCAQIVLTGLGYFAKATTENLSKNNQWPDKPRKEDLCSQETPPI